MEIGDSINGRISKQITARKRLVYKTHRACGMDSLAAALGFVLLNWTIRSIIPSEQAPGSSSTAIPSESFESNVRQGKICEGPLALAHGFSVYVTKSG
jgi:hypothetical protein